MIIIPVRSRDYFLDIQNQATAEHFLSQRRRLCHRDREKTTAWKRREREMTSLCG